MILLKLEPHSYSCQLHILLDYREQYQEIEILGSLAHFKMFFSIVYLPIHVTRPICNFNQWVFCMVSCLLQNNLCSALTGL